MSKLQSTLAACALMLYVLFAMTATTDAALPPGYEDVLLCPPTHCLTRRHDIVPGYVGPSALMHVCKSMNGEADRRPTAWGTRVRDAEDRLKTLLAQSYHRRSCRSLVQDTHPAWLYQRNPPKHRPPKWTPGAYINLHGFRPNRPLGQFREKVTDGYKSRIAYGMKPKRFEARNVKTMAYREKEPMILKDGLQEQFEESNDKDEAYVGSSAFKGISGAKDVLGSGGVGAAVQEAAKPPKKKVKATPSNTKTSATKNGKNNEHAMPLTLVAWCGAGALVVLLVGGATYRHIQRRKDREFVNIDSTNFISKHTKRKSLSQSGQIYESPHIISVV